MPLALCAALKSALRPSCGNPRRKRLLHCKGGTGRGRPRSAPPLGTAIAKSGHIGLTSPTFVGINHSVGLPDEALARPPRHNRQRRDTLAAHLSPRADPAVSQLGQNTANKILPHSRAYFVPTATNKDPPCTPLGQSSIKFFPISTPESFVKNRTQGLNFPCRIFFPTSTPAYPPICSYFRPNKILPHSRS